MKTIPSGVKITTRMDAMEADMPRYKNQFVRMENGKRRSWKKSNPINRPPWLEMLKKNVSPNGARMIARGRNHSIQFSITNS